MIIKAEIGKGVRNAKKIGLKEFKDLYRKHIVKDFPREERSNLNKFKKRILNGKEEAYIYYEDGKEKAYTIVAVLNNYVLVSYLAVFKEYRGKGIGTKLLEEIKENFSNKNGIILEVEDPNYSVSKTDKIIREKRIKFYGKSNYKIVENIGISFYTTVFKIMILNNSGKETEQKEIAEELSDFYKNISKRYGETLFFNIINNP